MKLRNLFGPEDICFPFILVFGTLKDAINMSFILKEMGKAMSAMAGIDERRLCLGR
jgi:hypothetical protein